MCNSPPTRLNTDRRPSKSQLKTLTQFEDVCRGRIGHRVEGNPDPFGTAATKVDEFTAIECSPVHREGRRPLRPD
jgi:hypothetical protein